MMGLMDRISLFTASSDRVAEYFPQFGLLGLEAIGRARSDGVSGNECLECGDQGSARRGPGRIQFGIFGSV